jgi:6-phosphogluconate dehydrogenase
MKQASEDNNWDLDGYVALLWRGSCIRSSAFSGNTFDAFSGCRDCFAVQPYKRLDKKLWGVFLYQRAGLGEKISSTAYNA